MSAGVTVRGNYYAFITLAATTPLGIAWTKLIAFRFLHLK